jgi:pyrrolidone-carboxylate peptidase
MLGVCGNDFFRLEHCARNVFTPEADVDGVLMFAGKNAVLVEGGPGSYVTTLPFGALWENLEQSISLEFGQPFANVDGIGVARSEDAGEFICNQVYYLACHFLSSSIPYIGFLHVPSISCFAEGFWAHQRTLSVGAKLVSTIAGLLRVR